jgi:nucleotide-binding universal stress UspA family protein
MATALQSIKMFVTYETAHAHAHGDAYDVAKAEVLALQELIRRAKAELELAQELAIDQGYAERKEVWTEEHVVKGHFKRRFTWRTM